MQEGFIPSDRMITDIPEFQEYRLLSEKALELVRSYNGTEDSYNKITAFLIELEEKALALKLAPSFSLPEQERITADILLPRFDDEKHDIGSLLDIAGAADSVRRIIHKALHERSDEHEISPLYIRRIASVLLPPAEQPRVQKGEGGFNATCFEERLFELTRLLLRGNIFLDDCVVTIGQLFPSQMRQHSYALVEIPRIDRSVLVCDQVGEATFVIHGLGITGSYLTMTKEQIQHELGANVRRVIGGQHWHSELGALLFTEEAWQLVSQQGQRHIVQAAPQRPKLDVVRFTEVRDAIFASKHNTLESWMNMTSKEAKAFKLAGFGLAAVASMLGIPDDPCAHKLARLECARKFFGDDPTLIQEIEKRKNVKQAPLGWMTRRALTREFRIGANVLENLIQSHLSTHHEWEKKYLDKKGRIASHLAPELCDLMRGERKSLEKAPLGWMARKALAQEFRIGANVLENLIQSHLSTHPEWEKEYLNEQGKIISHLAPELCNLVRGERKSLEKAPPGWMARKALAQELVVDAGTLKNFILLNLSAHPEWEKEYLDKMGKIIPHLAPELCDLVREKRKTLEKAPLGWMARKALAQELGINAKTFENLIKSHLSTHPEREKEYLNEHGKIISHLAPELCYLVREKRKTLEKAPPGWMTRRALAQELGTYTKIFENLIKSYLSAHPEREKEYLNEQGKILSHLAPELCDLVREER